MSHRFISGILQKSEKIIRMTITYMFLTKFKIKYSPKTSKILVAK